jgi:hypothetical protein
VEPDVLATQVLASWRRHNEILLHLLGAVPPKGLRAVPTGSRGRDVARQFAHLHRTLERYDKCAAPSKASLARSLKQSGAGVEDFLARGLRGEVRPRLFGHDIVRWFTYLVAHESHHRGQIALALKQAGLRLPDRVAVQGLWGKWIWGGTARSGRAPARKTGR